MKLYTRLQDIEDNISLKISNVELNIKDICNLIMLMI